MAKPLPNPTQKKSKKIKLFIPTPDPVLLTEANLYTTASFVVMTDVISKEGYSYNETDTQEKIHRVYNTIKNASTI